MIDTMMVIPLAVGWHDVALGGVGLCRERLFTQGHYRQHQSPSYFAFPFPSLSLSFLSFFSPSLSPSPATRPASLPHFPSLLVSFCFSYISSSSALSFSIVHCFLFYSHLCLSLAGVDENSVLSFRPAASLKFVYFLISTPTSSSYELHRVSYGGGVNQLLLSFNASRSVPVFELDEKNMSLWYQVRRLPLFSYFLSFFSSLLFRPIPLFLSPGRQCRRKVCGGWRWMCSDLFFIL